MVTRNLATCLLAGSLAFAPAVFASDTQEDSTSAATANSGQNNKDSHKRVDSQINRLSKKIDLTSDQKSQLQTQLAQTNQKTQKLWQQFASAHVQVIRLEAEMTAALESVLDPNQKEQTKKDRQSKAMAHSDQGVSAEKSNDKPAPGTSTKSAKNGSKTAGSNATKSSASTADRQTDDHASSNKNETESSTADATRRSARRNRSGGQEATEEYVWTMVIVPVQEVLNPLGLSAEQRQQTDRIFDNYHRKIVKGWQKIDQLHDQLVALEAQSILDVESVLTKDQRQKLMDMRNKSDSKKDRSEDSNRGSKANSKKDRGKDSKKDSSKAKPKSNG